MSVLGEYTDAIDNKDLQIWNNSAFDEGGDSESFNSCNNNQIKSPSWLTKKPVPVNNLSSDSFNSSFSSKENQSPSGFSNSKSKSSVLVHPLHESKLFNNLIKIGELKHLNVVVDDPEKTDEEIAIENEISRLVAKLESIRLERVQKNAKCVEKHGKSAAPKLFDLEKKKESGVKKIPNKIQRRGFSLGPNEIMSAATNSKSKQLGTTPVQSTQNRRKSCFWKLDDIEEEKCGFSRIRNPNLRQAVTTVGSKKGVKKDDSILGSIQAKRLFGDQSVPVKKPVKPGRVIPSRYNQATNSSMKKRSSSSFTDNVERKTRGGTEGRAKKKWEIPSTIVIPNRLSLDDNENEDESVNAVDVVMPELILPRIRVVRYVEDSGRESGPAKRVAELVGKKSYFDEEAVCQKLSFDED